MTQLRCFWHVTWTTDNWTLSETCCWRQTDRHSGCSHQTANSDNQHYDPPVFIFAQLLDHLLLLQLGQDGLVLLIGAVADVDGFGLAQAHAGLHELLDSRAKSTEVALQDSGSVLASGLKLRRHGGGRRSYKDQLRERERERRKSSSGWSWWGRNQRERKEGVDETQVKKTKMKKKNKT